MLRYIPLKHLSEEETKKPLDPEILFWMKENGKEGRITYGGPYSYGTRDGAVIGVYLEDRDAIAFKLRFGV